jgi:hypothetical protein
MLEENIIRYEFILAVVGKGDVQQKTTQLDLLAERLTEAKDWPETVIRQHHSSFLDTNVDWIVLKNGLKSFGNKRPC